MQYLEVSCAVRPIWWTLGVKWLRNKHQIVVTSSWFYYLPTEMMHGYHSFIHSVFCLTTGPIQWRILVGKLEKKPLAKQISYMRQFLLFFVVQH